MKIDEIILINDSFRSAFIALLLGIPKRIGRSEQGRGFMLTHKLNFNPDLDGNKHVSDHFMRLLEPIGFYTPDYEFGYSYLEQDQIYIEKILEETGCSQFNLVGFCPCSKISDKDWNPEEAAKFINYINQKSNHKVVIIGQQDASRFIEKLRSLGVNDFIDFTCKTNVSQLGALIHKFKMFLSVDTGSAHISYILKIPTLTLFFHENFVKWGPMDKNINTLLFNKDGIKAEEVIEEFIKLEKKLSDIRQQQNVADNIVINSL